MRRLVKRYPRRWKIHIYIITVRMSSHARCTNIFSWIFFRWHNIILLKTPREMLRNIKNEVYIRYTSVHAHVVTYNENIYMYILLSIFIRSKYHSIIVPYSIVIDVPHQLPPIFSSRSKTLTLFVPATKFFYLSRGGFAAILLIAICWLTNSCLTHCRVKWQ